MQFRLDRGDFLLRAGWHLRDAKEMKTSDPSVLGRDMQEPIAFAAQSVYICSPKYIEGCDGVSLSFSKAAWFCVVHVKVVFFMLVRNRSDRAALMDA